MAKKKETKLRIRHLDVKTISIKIRGTTGLICHTWSQKAKQMILDKQMKKKAAPKQAKDPQQDFEDSLYRLPDGRFGFPAVAFKASMVRAAKACGIHMVDARQMFHVMADAGDLVAITGEPTIREDMVRVGMGTADIRYRGEFRDWEAILKIRFNAEVVGEQMLLDFLTLAGFSVGVGEWRPERGGSSGTFEVVSG